MSCAWGDVWLRSISLELCCYNFVARYIRSFPSFVHLSQLVFWALYISAIFLQQCFRTVLVFIGAVAIVSTLPAGVHSLPVFDMQCTRSARDINWIWYHFRLQLSKLAVSKTRLATDLSYPTVQWMDMKFLFKMLGVLKAQAFARWAGNWSRLEMWLVARYQLLYCLHLALSFAQQ